MSSVVKLRVTLWFLIVTTEGTELHGGKAGESKTMPFGARTRGAPAGNQQCCPRAVRLLLSRVAERVFAAELNQLPPRITRVTPVGGGNLSHVLSHTFPLMSCSPSSFACKLPTGRVRLPLFASCHDTSVTVLLPECTKYVCVSVAPVFAGRSPTLPPCPTDNLPPFAANSHSCSVGSRHPFAPSTISTAFQVA